TAQKRRMGAGRLRELLTRLGPAGEQIGNAELRDDVEELRRPVAGHELKHLLGNRDDGGRGFRTASFHGRSYSGQFERDATTGMTLAGGASSGLATARPAARAGGPLRSWTGLRWWCCASRRRRRSSWASSRP